MKDYAIRSGIEMNLIQTQILILFKKIWKLQKGIFLSLGIPKFNQFFSFHRNTI